MVVGEKSLAKVHIHTNHPGLVLECCLRYGALHDLNINNMVEQNREMIIGREQAGLDKPFGIISVGAGEGITGIMKNLGADAVVTGGQTLNPSTGEILKVIEEIPAKKIIILPNNKNIILAAEQAGGLSRKEVTVIPSNSIPQGIGALLALNPQDSFGTAIRKMEAALTSVHSGEITTAVRDTTYKRLEIKKGEIIGLADGHLKVAGTDVAKVLGDLLGALLEDEGRLITLYYGDTMRMDQAEELAEKMRKKFNGQDFEVQQGGQPVYDLIISVE